MWKFAAILLMVAFCSHCVNAEDENPSKNDPQPSVFEIVFCYVSPKPWNCVKEQTGRMLNFWEEEIEEKKHELMVEADEEVKKSETSRGLSDKENKEQPSELIGALDRGLSAIANLVTNEVNVLRGRDSRAIKEGSKDIIDDAANDFNDDYSIYDALGRVEAEGKGKKGKKGKKGLMKMFFLGAIVKSKIEMLLKILSFHLQLKFFAIALAGLVINLARFWIDLKKQPQKVVYVEHAQHQHHYDEHDDWGSNWKRQSAPNQEYTQDFAHRLAYSGAQYPQQK